MKFNYQLTHFELAKSLSLLGLPTVGAWLVYLVVASAMFPSIILFAAIGAETCLTWFGVMLISILVASAWAFWKRTGYRQPFPQSMELTEDLLVHQFGHSRIECRWSVIDRVEQFPDHLQICAFGRPWMLPNRVLGERADDCLQFLRRVTSNETNLSTDRAEASARLPPVHLYREMILPGNTKRYQYQVSNQDLEQALQEKFNLVTPGFIGTNSARHRDKPTWLKVVLLCGLWLLFVGLTFLVSRMNDRPVTLEIVLLISLGWFSPIVWLLVWRRFSWLFRTRMIKHKVPDLVSTLTLTTMGWVIANPASGTFGHWKDLQFVLQSENFIGMRMINQLAYLIPKRIFSSSQEVDEFLALSLEYRQTLIEAESNFGSPTEPSTAIETCNPYQSPQR